MVITGTIGNRVVFTGSGVRIPSLPPKQKDTCRVSFCFGGNDSGIEYAATCCRRSHFSKAKIQPKVPACGKLTVTSPACQGCSFGAEIDLGLLSTHQTYYRHFYGQAPAKVPFEVYNGFLLEFNSKIVYNRKNNIAVIVRAFYEKKAYFDYMFISFILLDSFFGV